MQDISSALQSVLDKGQSEPRDLVDLIELYPFDYAPVDTFDPADASETFSFIEITWLGIAYRRTALSRSDASRFMGKSVNSCTINFSNADVNKYVASWVQNNTVEGMWCVVRTISASGSATLDDSTIVFVGRCGKPGDFEDIQGSIAVKQEIGSINQMIPPRKFQAIDPRGRQPSDPLFEGFRFIALNGSLTQTVRIPPTGLNAIFNKGKHKTETVQFSSHEDYQANQVVPMVFGRCQMSGVHVGWIDYGNSIAMVTAWCEGVIKQFVNLRNVSGKFTDIIITTYSPQYRYGSLGGVAGQIPFLAATTPSPWPGNGYYSRTAMTACFVNGSEVGVVEEAAPELACIIMGLMLPLSSTSFASDDWSDNPVDISRYILTHDRLLNVSTSLIDDDVLIDTAGWCDASLLDVTNGEVLYVPNGDLPAAGDLFGRYRSTGIIDSRSIGNDLGVYPTHRAALEGAYLGFDPVDPPGDPIPPDFPLPPGDPLPVTKYYRKRYTCNVPITDEMPAIDFLNNVIFPSFKGYMLWSGKGKLQIKSERAADSARLRVASAVGATSITVDDVTPWKTSLKGLLWIGWEGGTTSEVRKVTAVAYSASTVSLTKSVTGSVTATLSGATLSGGSPTVQASATVTIGGAATGSITLVIGGFSVTLTLDVFSTLAITAQMLAEVVNADRDLRKFIEASASGAVVTLKSKLGTLTLGAATTGAPSALINTHDTSLTQPTTAPTLSTASGTLAAGTYYVAYTFVRNTWETDHSDIASITITDGQKINTGSVAPPTGATVNWYVSRTPGSVSLGLIASNSGAAISINSYPEDGSYEMPQEDMTAEIAIRIAMAFASNNQEIDPITKEAYPFWEASKALTLNTIILPVTPNGHKYKVTTAGTTSSSEPTWPTSGTVTNGSVVFTEFGATILGQAGLTRSNIYKDTVRWPLPDRQQSYNQFKGKYREAKDDFAETPDEVNDFAHQRQINKIVPLEINLAAVDNHDQASRLLNAAAAKYRDGDYFLSHKTHARALVLEEGDVYCVSDASGGFVNFLLRAEEVRISPAPLCDVSLTGRKYSSLMYIDRARAHVVKLPTVLRYVQTVDTQFIPLDIPLYRESDAQFGSGIYVPVNRTADEGDWQGAYIYSDASGAYVPVSEKLDARIPMGDALTTLGAPANVTMLDTGSTGRVQITSLGTLGATYPLTSTTQGKLDNGNAHLCAWGAPGRWELLRFRDATPYSTTTDTYDLSVMWRGLHGTEANISNHTNTDQFVLLTDSDGNDLGTQFIPLDISLLGRTFNLKAQTVNQDVADASAVSVTWTGRSLLPFSVSNISRLTDLNSNALFEWVRRSRKAPGMRPNADVPLAEEEELYDLDVYSGANVVRPIRVPVQEQEIPMWNTVYNRIGAPIA